MHHPGPRAGGARREQSALRVSGWVAIMLLALVVPLSFVAAGTSVLPGDVAVTRFVQSRFPPALDPLLAVANAVGMASGTIALAGVIALGLLARGYRRQALLVVAATLAQVANPILKLTFESPRPTSSLVDVSERASGYGFPSGHVMAMTVLALILFYVVTTLMAAGPRRLLIQAGLLLLPLLMGVARVDAGAHWPSDVVGAWLWGSLTTIAIVWTVERSWSEVALPLTRSPRGVKRTAETRDIRRGISQKSKRHGGDTGSTLLSPAGKLQQQSGAGSGPHSGADADRGCRDPSPESGR